MMAATPTCIFDTHIQQQPQLKRQAAASDAEPNKTLRDFRWKITCTMIFQLMLYGCVRAARSTAPYNSASRVSVKIIRRHGRLQETGVASTTNEFYVSLYPLRACLY